MERRQFIKSTGLVAGLAGAGAWSWPVGAQSGGSTDARRTDVSMPEVNWRMTSSYPKSLDLIYGGCETFAHTVSEATGGRFKITCFPSGEIVPGLQAVDAVQNGTVEAAWTSLDNLWGKDPAFAFAAAVPFGMNARQTNAWLSQGGGDELVNELLADYKVVALPAGSTGCQMGGWFRKELKSSSDLNGLNMRVGAFAGKVLQMLGVAPQPIAGSKIVSSLEQGELDAAEWLAPYDDEKLGISKVAPFYYYPGWWKGSATLHIVMDQAKYNELPGHYQAIVRAAAALADADMQAKYDARNPPALKRLVVSGGAQLRPYPQEVLEACYKTAQELYRETAESNPRFKKIYDSYAAFRNDEYLWWQVGEYTFDNFMIRQRARG